jgi:hypothetical protein
MTNRELKTEPNNLRFVWSTAILAMRPAGILPAGFAISNQPSTISH